MTKIRSLCIDISPYVDIIKIVQDDIGNVCSFRPVPENTLHLTLFSFRDMLTNALEKEVMEYVSKLDFKLILEFESVLIIKKNIVVIKFKNNNDLDKIYNKILKIAIKHIKLPNDKIRNYTPHITIGKVKDNKKTFEYYFQNIKIDKLILT